MFYLILVVVIVATSILAIRPSTKGVGVPKTPYSVHKIRIPAGEFKYILNRIYSHPRGDYGYIDDPEKRIGYIPSPTTNNGGDEFYRCWNCVQHQSTNIEQEGSSTVFTVTSCEYGTCLHRKCRRAYEDN